MSKYNLTDIYEEFRAGDRFTTDFDYEGMLKAGLDAKPTDDLAQLQALSDSFEDVNYHRENGFLQSAIDNIKELGADHPQVADDFDGFYNEIKRTMVDIGMDVEDATLGQFMKNRMFEKDKEVKEVTSREGSRIEGLLDRGLKSKFLEAFSDLYFDLVEEDPFMAEDVVDHLAIEMLKHLDAIQAQGDRLAGIAEEDSIEEGISKDDIKKALKGTKVEIETYMDSLERSGDKFDSIEDYVEDFENYVADKSLQEHFGRFMKDYQ